MAATASSITFLARASDGICSDAADVTSKASSAFRMTSYLPIFPLRYLRNGQVYLFDFAGLAQRLAKIHGIPHRDYAEICRIDVLLEYTQNIRAGHGGNFLLILE